jgi:Gas vesicle synthesis protein GvpL/GvpF
VLAYCITEQKSQIDVPPGGVEAAPIKTIDAGTLRCFASDFATRMPDEPVPEMVKAFHAVLQRIFSQTGIIPFRFPTIVENDETLRKFVLSRSAEYASALRRLRNKVQMDIRVTLMSAGAPESSQRSGKSYLEGRRAQHHKVQSILTEFRRVSNMLAENWVERDSASGIHGFVLLDRSSLPVFLEKIGRVRTPAGVSARITGPWPPSEFVEAAHE